MFTLGRKIDFTYKTNKIILIISIIVAAIGSIMTKDIKSGLYLGGGSFLTWALAREVDPKHDYSAFVAVGLSLINLFYFKSIQLLVLLYIILFLRLASGITGKKATLLDMLSVFALSVFLTINMKNSIYLVPFISVIISQIRIEGKSKRYIAILVVSSIVFLAESLFFQMFAYKQIDLSNATNILVVTASFIFIVWGNFIKIDGALDDRGNPVDEKKIRSSQMLYGSSVLLLFLFTEVSLNNLIIYFAVMFGIIIYSMIGKKSLKDSQ